MSTLHENLLAAKDLRPQSTKAKNYFTFNEDGKTCGCASALLAEFHGLKVPDNMEEAQIEKFPYSSEIVRKLEEHYSTRLSRLQYISCQYCDHNHKSHSILNLIYHLNDDHKFSIEEIAEHLVPFDIQQIN